MGRLAASIRNIQTGQPKFRPSTRGKTRRIIVAMARRMPTRSKPTSLLTALEAAEHGTGHRGQSSGQTEERKRRPALTRRKDHLGDRQCLRRHHRRRNPLGNAGRDQHLDIGSHAAQCRGGGKAGHAREKDPPAADQIAEPSERQEPDGKGENIGCSDPFYPGIARSEIGLKARQGDVDDRHVDQVHEAGHQHDGHCDPPPLIGFRHCDLTVAGRHRSHRYGFWLVH